MLNHIIQNNPYRLLGIYSNSPIKERVANHNRLKAFLKVGKALSFPLDLQSLLPPLSRTEESIAEADAKLALPTDQLRYAQFWFIKVTPMDEIAMNHLMAGNMDTAVSIWGKKDNASSLQNRIVCALVSNDYAVACSLADKLYSCYSADFTKLVLGENHTATTENLGYTFLDELSLSVGAQKLLPCLANQEWKRYVENKTVKPLIDALQSAIDEAKAAKGKGPDARLAAGTKLLNETKTPLAQLKALLTANDLQYQMIADKLGLEILQCGIDYYNASEAADAAHKAMRLQAYALSIVVGKMAKDRCKENVDILQKIIDDLPPKEVFAEDKAIKEELRKFCQLPDKICHAVTLLNNTKPHLQAIKQKLGATNAYYLKISTQVVGNALHNVIEEVNFAQREDDNNGSFGIRSERDKAMSAMLRLVTVKAALKEAWNATELMDTFDMEADFKTNRYNKNRSILKDLCDQLGVSTYIPAQNTKPSRSTSTTSDNSDSSDGCVTGVAWLIIAAVIGGIIAGVGGAVIGAVIGIGLLIYHVTKAD